MLSLQVLFTKLWFVLSKKNNNVAIRNSTYENITDIWNSN